ncbi:hypothetical protein ACVIHI_008603 [Bradyrhizobium sp. USDA 4524]|uniref:hypothetical protein n=1 Tax=unclassified Bradyrhizobium TaxID=2631580 RepID=UPI0020A13584|nr:MULTISPECIES: hypothetical protein [unclassified Bradyrhizobium]MCP1845934.1 hypothetical protein [Bradyrhizobium sp. USDA 4538]MCP1907432.1 hypothetical protein [Bradyrhizobium sp. USDA 4537]MCP1985218.1 hypothetical protein [Bradyrhizobium sp. USDA 4539]
MDSTPAPLVVDVRNVQSIGGTGPGVGRGIHVANDGTGAATIYFRNGTLISNNPYQPELGLWATNDAGLQLNPANHSDTSIYILGGTITSLSHGALSENWGRGGDAIIDMSAGTVATQNAGANGLYALILDSQSTGAARVTLSGGSVTSRGGSGLVAQTPGLGAALVTISGGTVSAQGSNGHGAFATITNAANAKDATITLTVGSVTATGTGGNGLNATTAGTGNAVVTAGAGTTIVSQRGVGINAVSNRGNVVVTSNGTVTGATGIRGSAPAGTVTITTAGATTGTAGSAIQVDGALRATVNNSGNATTSSLTAAVVDVRATNGTIINNQAGGQISGASDLAILSHSGTTVINNNGTIIGYVTLLGSNNVFNNNSPNSFDTRDYVNGVQHVAVSQINGDFNNNANGVLRLLYVDRPQSVDNTGAYQPAGSLLPTPTNGVAQGQLLGVRTFDNRGIITLQGADTGAGRPIAGDALVITGGTRPGTDGGGVFISDGGGLRLDTVLNAGGPQSLSDVLVVDSTRLGSGGATRISVANAGGAGAPTLGNGIMLVDVLNKNASAPDVFVLNGQYTTKDGRPAVVAGAYGYTLFHGGVGGSAADGNWYLRSQLVPPNPVPPPPASPASHAADSASRADSASSSGVPAPLPADSAGG